MIVLVQLQNIVIGIEPKEEGDFQLAGMLFRGWLFAFPDDFFGLPVFYSSVYDFDFPSGCKEYSV